MELLGILLTVGGYAAVPAAAGAWIFQRWRSWRRNTRDACASCGTPWSELTSGERFLIHGRLVCAPCGTGARRRLGWQLGLLGGAGVLSSVTVLLGGDPAIWALLPPALVAVVGAGVVGLMKLANREAGDQIAAGTYPFLPPGEDWRLGDPESL